MIRLLRATLLPLIVLGYSLIKSIRSRQQSAINVPFIGLGKKRIFIHAVIFLIALLASRSAFSASNHSSQPQSILLSLISPSQSQEALIEDSSPAATPQDTTSDTTLSSASVDPEVLQLFVYDEEQGEEGSEDVALNSDQDALESTLELPGAPSERTETVEYIVRDGDTASSIAQTFGVSTDTILSENNLTANSPLHIGQRLRILPTTGISYTIVRGDTIESIASKTHADADAIRSTNNLTNDSPLAIGSTIVIPNGRITRTVVATRPAIRERLERLIAPANLDISDIVGLVWPTVQHHINQYFTWRHYGLDIKGTIGTPIYAINDGVVLLSGWNRGGYGQQVVLKHSGNVLSRYGHMSKIIARAGETVHKGQVIGLIGSTGHSTGPHLHFEIIKNGKRINPLNVY